MPYAARLATALLAVLGLVAAPANGAPTCRLVSDPAGDHTPVVSSTAAVVSSDLDVLSADVAVDKRNVVVAIRLASLKAYDTLAPTREYVVTFDIDDMAYWRFHAWVGALPGAYVSGPGAYDVKPTLAVDIPRREIRIAASSKILGPTWAGAPFQNLAVRSGSYYGYPGYARQIGPLSSSSAGYGYAPTMDIATTDRVYVGGAPTCVLMPG